MLTYKQYIAHCQRMQRRYIADEMKRNAKLSKLWYEYKAKAHKLGFHPLDRSEIEARADQLKMMAARVEETHGDSPTQRALYEMRQAEQATACPTPSPCSSASGLPSACSPIWRTTC